LILDLTEQLSHPGDDEQEQAIDPLRWRFRVDVMTTTSTISSPGAISETAVSTTSIAGLRRDWEQCLPRDGADGRMQRATPNMLYPARKASTTAHSRAAGLETELVDRRPAMSPARNMITLPRDR